MINHIQIGQIINDMIIYNIYELPRKITGEIYRPRKSLLYKKLSDTVVKLREYGGILAVNQPDRAPIFANISVLDDQLCTLDKYILRNLLCDLYSILRCIYILEYNKDYSIDYQRIDYDAAVVDKSN